MALVDDLIALGIAPEVASIIAGAGGGGGGETNTASNVGTAGVGVFKQKNGVNLEFKKLNAGSSRVTITDDTGNSEIDINVPVQMSITSDSSGIMLQNDAASPGNSRYYGTDSGGSKGYFALPSGGSGESNTASNVGTAGVGVFKQKTGVNLEFRNINTVSSNRLTVTSDTGNNEIDLDVPIQMSLTSDASGIKLVNDATSPGNSRYYGTDSGGTKGYFALPGGGSGETNTASNVGVGGVGVFKQKTGVNLEFRNINTVSSNRLTVTSDTGNNEIDLDVPLQMSLTSDASGIRLSGDAASPGNNKVYGTDGSGVKGWKSDPGGGGSLISVVAHISFGVSGGVVTVLAKSSNLTLTRTGAGDFAIAFSAALSSANYCVSYMTSSGLFAYQRFGLGAPSASAFNFATSDIVGTFTDPSWCSLQFSL